MANQKFTYGRYKDKTFEEVYELDRKFCETVLQSSGSFKCYPREFKEYLKSKMLADINERFVVNFVDRWSANVRSEFESLVSDLNIVKNAVHSKSDAKTNGDIGFFYRMFIRKCIFNLKNDDARLTYAENYAAIFPFRVTKEVRDANIPVRELFDEEFYNAVGAFVSEHFEDVSATEVIDLLLKNVYEFRRNNFSCGQFRKLKGMYESGFSGQSFGTGDNKLKPVCKYLETFPRLNYSGVRRYEQMCQIYKEIFQMYHTEKPEEMAEPSWRYLPEINCYELLCLLEADFYTAKRAEYEKLLKKYLFFFNNAINSEEKPVFFIDRLLFECLKSYAKFKKSRLNPQELQFVLWMMTLVHRRRQRSDFFNRNFDRVPKDVDMANVQNYLESFPQIKSASVDLLIETRMINSQIFITTPTSLLTSCFSSRERAKLSDFAALLIDGALCPRDIKKLVIYNAYSGVETCAEMPRLKAEIMNFVRRHNKRDMSVNPPPEDFITRDLEQYFEKYTIDWGKKNELSSE